MGNTAWRRRSHMPLNAGPLPRLPISVPAKTDDAVQRYSDSVTSNSLGSCERFRLIQTSLSAGHGERSAVEEDL